MGLTAGELGKWLDFLACGSKIQDEFTPFLALVFRSPALKQFHLHLVTSPHIKLVFNRAVFEAHRCG